MLPNMGIFSGPSGKPVTIGERHSSNSSLKTCRACSEPKSWAASGKLTSCNAVRTQGTAVPRKQHPLYQHVDDKAGCVPAASLDRGVVNVRSPFQRCAEALELRQCATDDSAVEGGAVGRVQEAAK
eukprot:5372499-Prymnesium_polylepis.4